MPTQSNATPETGPLAALGRRRQSLQESVWYTGWLLTFLATGKETGWRFALIEAVTRKGNVPPPHTHHREDELFYILEGEITPTVGGQKIKGAPGTMIFGPRGVAHSIEIESDQARMLLLLTPAGLEGYFRECSVTAPVMTLPPPPEIPCAELLKLQAIAARYGIEGVAPAASEHRP